VQVPRTVLRELIAYVSLHQLRNVRGIGGLSEPRWLDSGEDFRNGPDRRGEHGPARRECLKSNQTKALKFRRRQQKRVARCISKRKLLIFNSSKEPNRFLQSKCMGLIFEFLRQRSVPAYHQMELQALLLQYAGSL